MNPQHLRGGFQTDNYPPGAAAPDLVKNPSLSGGQGPCQIVTMTISATVVRKPSASWLSSG
jgi:hypothetical protein